MWSVGVHGMEFMNVQDQSDGDHIFIAKSSLEVAGFSSWC